MHVALTIAGSDPSGGAGIQADLKTFHQFGVYGEAAITLLTVQNTTSVEQVQYIDGDLIRDQIRSAIDDIPPMAIKTGALGTADAIEAVVDALRDAGIPLVVDPVMVSKHGALLMDRSALDAFAEKLMPRAALVTPNLHEAGVLTGVEVNDLPGMRRAGERLIGMGAKAVLVKGGHLSGNATDVLYSGGRWYDFPAPRLCTGNTHGAGCTYSAAITASLATGCDLISAVNRAKRFATDAIRTSPGLGRGAGPLNHFAD